MQTCKDVCPVYHIHRCCFHCDKRNECGDVCAEESNDLCELLVEMEDSPEKVAEPILKELVQIQKQKANLEEKEKDLKERLKGIMEDAGITGFKNNPYMKVTYIKASSSLTFDTTLFKKSCPEVYSKYCTKPKETKAYIKCEAPDNQKGGENE